MIDQINHAKDKKELESTGSIECWRYLESS